MPRVAVAPTARVRTRRSSRTMKVAGVTSQARRHRRRWPGSDCCSSQFGATSAARVDDSLRVSGVDDLAGIFRDVAAAGELDDALEQPCGRVLAQSGERHDFRVAFESGAFGFFQQIELVVDGEAGKGREIE